jgi:hypothetical protein
MPRVNSVIIVSPSDQSRLGFEWRRVAIAGWPFRFGLSGGPFGRIWLGEW